jgi:hypothetical protein
MPASSPRTPLVAQQVRILCLGAAQRVRLAGGTGLSLEDQFPIERKGFVEKPTPAAGSAADAQ